jgi:hypothetical protein
MVLKPILLGGVWFIIHRYSVFHTFIWRGGLSQMKLTSFEKNCHILRRSLRKTRKKRQKMNVVTIIILCYTGTILQCYLSKWNPV